MIPRILHAGRGLFPRVHVLDWDRGPMSPPPDWVWGPRSQFQLCRTQGPYLVAILKEEQR